MNTAAKRIYNKYHKPKLKLPMWSVVMIIFILTILVSAWVAVSVAQSTMDMLVQHMPDMETVYVQETGKYPDWFIEWMNTEYLPEIAGRETE